MTFVTGWTCNAMWWRHVLNDDLPGIFENAGKIWPFFKSFWNLQFFFVTKMCGDTVDGRQRHKPMDRLPGIFENAGKIWPVFKSFWNLQFCAFLHSLPATPRGDATCQTLACRDYSKMPGKFGPFSNRFEIFSFARFRHSVTSCGDATCRTPACREFSKMPGKFGRFSKVFKICSFARFWHSLLCFNM